MEIVTIFGDGSSRGNPGRGGWGAVAVYPDSHGFLRVDELGGREDETTNNRMEISAIAGALQNFDSYHTTEQLKGIIFHIYTDSSYVMKGATEWIKGWKKNEWMTKAKEDVKNRDLWEGLATVLEGKKIQWHLVPGHSGIIGNERCDVIATMLADNEDPKLYMGAISGYMIKDILNISIPMGADGVTPLKKKKSSSSSKNSGKVAYSYISALDGKVMTHKTWAECEARVKGKSGARFKKSFSKEDEAAIIEDFS